MTIKQKVSTLIILVYFICNTKAFSQKNPMMGWMSWNLYGTDINEAKILGAADALVASGLAKNGFNYICIDDGWQGGRDNKNNMIPDPKKFPNGIKFLSDYIHAKGLKIGIYSDAAELTCGKYTASLGFENQDAKTFAAWNIDFLKYDYCNAPTDKFTAMQRYTTMATALSNCGREIKFGICEWGQREPWTWAASVGGTHWRTTWDVRDLWQSAEYNDSNNGIYNIYKTSMPYTKFVEPGKYNDLDMLVVGLYGKGDASSISAASKKGCTNVEYQSQMSLWSLLCSPLMISCDVAALDNASAKILKNADIIKINQDEAFKPAELKLSDNSIDVLLKPLVDGSYAIGIVNKTDGVIFFKFNFSQLGLTGKYGIKNVWTGKTNLSAKENWAGSIESHETIVLIVKKSSM